MTDNSKPSAGEARCESIAGRLVPLESGNVTRNLWGGDWIAAWKGRGTGPIGEAWEYSSHVRRSGVALVDGTPTSLSDLRLRCPDLFAPGGDFLFKIIDARDDLSVQVHPRSGDDAEGGDAAKTESWAILDAEPGACLYIGFRCDGSPAGERKDRFLDAIARANGLGASADPAIRRRAERLVLPFLNRIPVRRADLFHVAAGTIHAIGSGVRLAEIQQSSDATYRVWDWNRMDPSTGGGRPLHLERAAAVLDFEGRPPAFYAREPRPGRTRGETILFDEPGLPYRLRRIDLRAGESMVVELGAAHGALCVLEGGLRAAAASGSAASLAAGQTAFLPKAVSEVHLKTGDGPAVSFLAQPRTD